VPLGSGWPPFADHWPVAGWSSTIASGAAMKIASWLGVK
jgi:hypothetical protein